MTDQSNWCVETTKRSLEMIDIVKNLNGATAAEIQEQTGMAESTVYKHINALLDQGYLIKRAGKYELGFELFHLGEYVKKSVQYYKPIKEKTECLRENLPEQVEFCVESNGLVIGYIVSTDYDPKLFYELTERNESQTVDYAGSKGLMHTNAVGKALLAEKTDSEIRKVVDTYGLQKQAKKTITSLDDLFNDIEDIREKGYATTDEEWDNGLREIGMTVKLGEDVIGGFNVFGPVYQVNDQRLYETLPQVLEEAVNDLEEEIAAQME